MPNTKHLVSGVAVLILGGLGYFLFFLLTEKDQPPVTTTTPPAQIVAPAAPSAEKLPPLAQPVAPEADTPAPSLAAKKSEAAPTAIKSPPTITDFLAEKGYVEFTAEDARYAEKPIAVNLGNYRVRKGDEFEVAVQVQAPALESFTLLMNYDPELLECLPDTAHPVGKSFHMGIEFYADQQKGKMVLINAGLPGAKNINPTDNQTVAVFRMVAKGEGQTQIICPETGVNFTNAIGREVVNYKINGGAISIRE